MTPTTSAHCRMRLPADSQSRVRFLKCLGQRATQCFCEIPDSVFGLIFLKQQLQEQHTPPKQCLPAQVSYSIDTKSMLTALQP